MSSQFRTRSLLVLDRIYDLIQGDRAPSRIDLRSPIQLVHNTSREAELNALASVTQGGLIFPQITLTFAMAETLEDDFEVLADGTVSPNSSGWAGFPPGPAPADVWFWLLNVGVTAEAAVNLTGVSVSVFNPVLPGRGAAQDMLVFRANTEVALNPGVSGQDSAYVGSTFPAVQNRLPAPFLLDGSVRVQATSGAAGVALVNLVVWVGKIGTYPPGMC